MKKKSIFITGTDTNVGKTHASLCLLNTCAQLKLSTVATKPIASGCQYNQAGILVNADALLLQQHASISRKYSDVNPIALQQPIAPHLAAAKINRLLTAKDIIQILHKTPTYSADIHIIEGVGGWMTPLNDNEYMSDVISALKIPVILVVAMRLGCLNHAILTSQSIIQQNIPFIGWIANCIDPNMNAIYENITTLEKHIAAPKLAIIDYGKKYLSKSSNSTSIFF